MTQPDRPDGDGLRHDREIIRAAPYVECASSIDMMATSYRGMPCDKKISAALTKEADRLRNVAIDIRRKVAATPPSSNGAEGRQWPRVFTVKRADNTWHADISFARYPTDAELQALEISLRDDKRTAPTLPTSGGGAADRELHGSSMPPDGTGAAEPVARDTNMFSRLADEPMAVIPEGYSAPLDIRTAAEIAFDRKAAKSPAPPVRGDRDIAREAKEWCETGLLDESDKRAVMSFTRWLLSLPSAPVSGRDAAIEECAKIAKFGAKECTDGDTDWHKGFRYAANATALEIESSISALSNHKESGTDICPYCDSAMEKDACSACGRERVPPEGYARSPKGEC
jgi:hypothetical protein